MMELTEWASSQTYHQLLAYIEDMSASAKANITGVKSDLLVLLEESEELLDSSFAIVSFEAGASRFGSPAFRQFLRRVDELVADKRYSRIKKCFGSAERLDYGTGHELEFILLLMSLDSSADFFFSVYPAYYRLVKLVIQRFRLEPAGSRGVWGLDDYFFAPFLFGSAQLAKHPVATPEEAVSKDIARKYKDDYLYLEAVYTNYEQKGDCFAEHSSVLWDISGLPSWKKIHTGLAKMYIKEVLQSPALVQHIEL
jgi:serine/threonine-protein phosphatase 2A activator